MNVRKTNEKGFTIIEVVLVLAIAALIFLMVFIALPALQRSQRDTSRKNDVGVVSSAVVSFSSNNKGAAPATAADITSYVQNNLGDNRTLTLTSGAQTNTGTGATNDVIAVVKSAKCGTNGATVAGVNSQFAVVVKLESGSNVYYCQDN